MTDKKTERRLKMMSVILPVYNERECLEELAAQLTPVLELMAIDYEVIFVDDGSSDGSAEILASLSDGNPRLKSIHFSRNFGHQAALQAGLDAAKGTVVVMMDADLQDPPSLLVEFLKKWHEGFDIVYAVRKKRKEGLLLRTAYALFYRSLQWIGQTDIPLDAGDFCLLDRRVVDQLVSLKERNRFLRGLRSWIGFPQTSVEYERGARFAGTPKYTFGRLLTLALSGYIGFSMFPLRLATWSGFVSAAIGFVLAVWAIATRILHIPSPRGWASTVSIILFVGGVQLMMLGVIGEYLSRVYDEVRQRPLYIIRSRTGMEKGQDET